MVIHLVVPAHAVAQNFETYKRIIDILHERGHSIARNWIEPAYYQSQAFGVPGDIQNREDIVQQIFESLSRADAIIADISDRGTFGGGYQVALARQQGKPVLLLHRKDTPEGLLPTGLGDELLTCVDFDERDLEEHVQGFLRRVEV